MKIRGLLAIILCLAVLISFVRPVSACGPNYIAPIFVFENSPDLPFTDYLRGNIGIVRPSFGRKTLFIAYRFLNGGSFSAGEQEGLLEALKGKPPEDDGTEAIKTWIASRKEVVSEEQKPPEIYTERQYTGYDFFPNCAKNAFEVATATLKDRVARFGATDRNVRTWLATQDLVFQNCQSSGSIPAELGAESPVWLRKDRDYQIAAAMLYSLNFDEARARFERIARDSESTWQQTADYLVGRTLVRQASLTDDEKKQREIYEQAERHMQILAAQRGPFSNAAQKFVNLIRFRMHPEERVRELASILMNQNSGENLKQDLIDYTWLHDKFENQILKEEEKRKKAAQPDEVKTQSEENPNSREGKEKYDAVQRGERILLNFIPRQADGNPDYTKYLFMDFKVETSWAEVLRAFEAKAGRNLIPEEEKELNNQYLQAIEHQKYLVSPNRKFDRGALSQYEGCYYDCGSLTLDLVPDFLRDDLSDWIFTLRTEDTRAYAHAVAKWNETQSPAWLVVALSKAERNSVRLEGLMRDAEKINHNSPAFATASYHLARLKISLGRKAEARKLLDEIIAADIEGLPISARNQFFGQRMQLAESLNEFLKFSQRRVAAFYDEAGIGKMSDLLEVAKNNWDPKYYEGTKEEHEQSMDKYYADRLLWDDRFTFDETTLDALNTHFPLAVLARAARSPSLPGYLRRQFVFAIWTRAVVLGNAEIAEAIAPEVLKVAPEMQTVFSSYMNARTVQEKEQAALVVLLKFSSLSPLVVGGLPEFKSAEEIDYYFESSWWCTPSETEYNSDGNEVPRSAAKPMFLTAEELAAARRERVALIAIGNGSSYLGKRVLAWARTSPEDARVPEALFIAAKANEAYKYGCTGWQNDQETLEQLVALLRNRYPQSAWTAKLPASDGP